MRQFENLNATSLYCNDCGQSMPVREKLLLILPDGYLYEYLCTGCGHTVGDKKTSLAKQDRNLLK
ncbi:MAG: cytoplasmic protein [Candidatus Omnitrophota bacterium]